MSAIRSWWVYRFVKSPRWLGFGAVLFWVTVAADNAYALGWDETSVTVIADPLLGETTASFTFTNDSGRAITIQSIKSSCGCTVPTLKQRTYEAGEAGELFAVFRIGKRQGNQSKRIVVRTDDPDRPVSVLTLRVEIVRVLKLDPKQLVWTEDQERAPRTIEIRWVDNGPLHNISIQQAESGADWLAVEILKPERPAASDGDKAVADPGKPIRLRLTPDSDAVGTALVRLNLLVPESAAKPPQLVLPVQVQPLD